jgi:hypothetical protein
MHHSLQFGMRENPASNRRHGSRLQVNDSAYETTVGEVELYKRGPSQGLDQVGAGFSGIQHDALCHATTREAEDAALGFANLEIIGLKEELSTTSQDD